MLVKHTSIRLFAPETRLALVRGLLGALVAPVAVPLLMAMIWGLASAEGLLAFLENQGADSVRDHLVHQQRFFAPVMILGGLLHTLLLLKRRSRLLWYIGFFFAFGVVTYTAERMN